MFECCTCVLFDHGAVYVDAVERVEVVFELVVTRLQLSAERNDHGLQLGLKLLNVDKLPALFGEGQLFELAINALGHGAFVRQVDAVLRSMTGRLGSQVFDVGEPDSIKRRHPPIQTEPFELRTHRLLRDTKVICDFLLGWHALLSQPPWVIGN